MRLCEVCCHIDDHTLGGVLCRNPGCGCDIFYIAERRAHPLPGSQTRWPWGGP